MTSEAKSIGVPNVYCTICKTADVPGWDWRKHGEPCRSRGEISEQGLQIFMTALATLFKDGVTFETKGWQVQVQCGKVRVRLLVTEVQEIENRD